MIQRIWSDLRGSGSARSSLAVALAIALLCVFIGESLPQMILDLRKQMNLTNEQANLIRFLPATTGLLIVPSAGHITDLLGAKRVLILSLATICGGSFVIAISHGINVLIIGLLLMGLGQMSASVTGYTLLTKTASTSKQLGLFIAAWGITANIGYLLFPPFGSWVLVHSERGWISMSLLWAACSLSLLTMSQYKLRPMITSDADQQDKPAADRAKGNPGWSWLIVTGIIFSLTTAIPVADVLNPGITGLLIAIDATGIAILCRLISRSKQAQRDLQFLRNPAIVLALLSLAATYLVDWNYFSERIIGVRYLLNINQTSSWLTPANLSGLIGASLFGTISLRFGLLKTTASGLMIWLLTPLIFLLATTATPIWVIAGSIAAFTMLEALVFTGLQSSATEMVAKSSLGLFGSVMTGLNTITDSMGGALTSDVMLKTYRDNFHDHLQPLPLSDSLTATILKWLTEGKHHLILENNYNIPSNLINKYLQKGSPPQIDSVIRCLHVLGYLCIAMIILSAIFYAGSLIIKQRSIRQVNV